MPVAQRRSPVVLALAVLFGIGVPWLALTGTTSAHASVTRYDTPILASVDAGVAAG